MAGFQTKTQLKELLDASARHPRKRFGQHFLIDRNLMQKLIDAAEVEPEDCILEVGTGTGSLTAMLAECATRVVTVEIDADVASIASEQLAAFSNVQMILGDALESKSQVSAKVLESLPRNGSLKLVANLPYDIATVLVINLLMSDLRFARMCFTVQAEVGDRFLADKDTADFGPISILTSIVAKGSRICRVPPQAFWPEPKVDSVMLRLDVIPPESRIVQNVQGFAAFLRYFFQHRRKTLGHIAKKSPLEGVANALADLSLDPQLRPENVDSGQWADWFNRLPLAGKDRE